jgi:predicted nucleic acid-binding protein
MKYLLDVNLLVAWHHTNHPGHARFHAWARKHTRTDLVSCAITDLGFLRVSMQSYGYSLEKAEMALAEIEKDGIDHLDSLPKPRLPRWATTGPKTTGAYLCQLARAHGLQLATFDGGIKDAAAFLVS